MARAAKYLLALALASGFVDAASYLALGRVFTANMTGNTVLLGVAAGVALIRGAGGSWPMSARLTFVLEIAALTALLVTWTAIGVPSFRYGLIALSGFAMGTQSAAVRAARAGGIATTYVTGTLTNAIGRAVEHARGTAESAQGAGLAGGVWVTYAIGALGGAALESKWHGAVIAVPLAIVCAVGAVAVLGRD